MSSIKRHHELDVLFRDIGALEVYADSKWTIYDNVAKFYIHAAKSYNYAALLYRLSKIIPQPNFCVVKSYDDLVLYEKRLIWTPKGWRD